MNVTHQSSLIARLWQYQKERFPLFGHGLLILAFTFSALAYSNVCRHGLDLISIPTLLKAFVNTFCIFFLLRISDEFKDKEFDAEHRPHLPVPRGLVNLNELKYVGFAVLLFLTVFNVVFASAHLHIYVFVLLYLGLMFKEFFVKHWIEKRQLIYVASHMMIIPLVDTLASSFDWIGNGADYVGLVWFFAVSFWNGCTLELGRKIKVKENEEANTYSYSLGFNKALNVFFAVLTVTYILCLCAAYYANMHWIHLAIFSLLYVVTVIYAMYYKNHRTVKASKFFEMLSGLWAIGMYLNLGAGIFFK